MCFSSMAWTDTLAMRQYYFGDLETKLQGTNERTHLKSRDSGMACESDWIKYRKSSRYTAQTIQSATFFMPWSLKIPIGDSYHEIL